MIRDIVATGAPVPIIVEEDWAADPQRESLALRSPDGSGRGVSMPARAPAATQVAEVADQVQEWVIEELWRAAPTNWPPCPHHPATHPMRAETRDPGQHDGPPDPTRPPGARDPEAAAGPGDTAMWICPATGAAVAPIGTLRR